MSHDPLKLQSCIFTESDFQKIARIARQHFGLSLSPAKYSLIQSRLHKRMAKLGMRKCSDYLLLLEGHRAEEERTALLSVLTTNVTHFFREPYHFETLKTDVLMPLLTDARQGRPVRIWSTGCSTGQEAFSIAMTLLKICPDAARLNIKILATDIDPLVIEKAMLGCFKMSELAELPSEYLEKFIKIDEDGQGGTIKQRVQSLITFGVLNLIEPFPFKGSFDAIFCRNVAIYFDKETQMMLWQKLASVLQPEGYLFIGHSERIRGPAEGILKKAGTTTFQYVPEGSGI